MSCGGEQWAKILYWCWQPQKANMNAIKPLFFYPALSNCLFEQGPF